MRTLRSRAVGIMAAFTLALGVMVAGSSPAMAWTPAGAYTLTGSVTSVLQLPGTPSLTCDVTLQADLFGGIRNEGDVTNGEVTNCTTTLPNCAVTVTTGLELPDATPVELWPLFGMLIQDEAGVLNVAGVNFAATYSDSGGNCAVTGAAASCTFSVAGPGLTPPPAEVLATYDGNTGDASFLPGGDLLDVQTGGTCLVPSGTDVDLTGTLTVQGTPPTLEP